MLEVPRTHAVLDTGSIMQHRPWLPGPIAYRPYRWMAGHLLVPVCYKRRAHTVGVCHGQVIGPLMCSAIIARYGMRSVFIATSAMTAHRRCSQLALLAIGSGVQSKELSSEIFRTRSFGRCSGRVNAVARRICR
jgi:hypothetical protein